MKVVTEQLLLVFYFYNFIRLRRSQQKISKNFINISGVVEHINNWWIQNIIIGMKVRPIFKPLVSFHWRVFLSSGLALNGIFLNVLYRIKYLNFDKIHKHEVIIQVYGQGNNVLGDWKWSKPSKWHFFLVITRIWTTADSRKIFPRNQIFSFHSKSFIHHSRSLGSDPQAPRLLKNSISFLQTISIKILWHFNF